MRPATPRDIPALVELVNSGYRGESSEAGWTTEGHLLGGQRTDPDSLATLLAKPDAAVLLHDDGAKLLGCVHVELAREHAAVYIGMLTVLPTGQRGGLGRTLLDAAEQYGRERWHVAAARMTVIAQRTELIAWYERRGYQLTGETEPFPYHDERFGLPKRDDLYFVILAKPLPAADGG
jgi:ribosomal protein S18 acetylase RimI-like enzyme